MTKPLDPNSEYLVATDLSELELALKIAELREMRGMVEKSTPISISEREPQFLQHQYGVHKGPVFDTTFFVVRPDLYIRASVNEPYTDQPWSLSLSTIEGSVSRLSSPMLMLPEGKERTAFGDCTVRGLENDLPGISKGRALAAIDRWIALLLNPLPQAAPDQPPPAAVACARDFIGSVAALAKKRGVAAYVLPSLDEDPVNREFTVGADFPTVRQLPQVTFSGWRNDDWGHEYEYLTEEAAAIYACALPTIIEVVKSYWRGSPPDDGSEEPFGLYFRNWRSPDLPFEPSAAMDPILGHLPSLPVDAIIPPIFSDD